MLFMRHRCDRDHGCVMPCTAPTSISQLLHKLRRQDNCLQGAMTVPAARLRYPCSASNTLAGIMAHFMICCGDRYLPAKGRFMRLQDWQSLRQAWQMCSGSAKPGQEARVQEAAAATDGLVMPTEESAACSSLGLCLRLFGNILPGVSDCTARHHRSIVRLTFRTCNISRIGTAARSYQNSTRES